MRTDAHRRADKVYKDKHKPINFTVQYNTDKLEGQRLKAYLAQTGQSANSYIKELIKADLDSKGVEYTLDSSVDGSMRSNVR